MKPDPVRALDDALDGPACGLVAAVLALPDSRRRAVLVDLLRQPAPKLAGSVAERARAWRRHRLREFLGTVQAAFDALQERGAAALQQHLDRVLAAWPPRGGALTWLLVRTFVRGGLVPAPDHDGYRQGLWELGAMCTAELPLVAELRADPQLLGEPLFALFEMEGDRERSFANLDKYGRDGAQWAPALLELARSGELPRDRLLAAALGALARDFPAYRATWFARLHDALEPTAAERRRHFGDYVRLVASRIPQVQSFAMQSLAAAARVGVQLAPEQLPELEPAWSARQKSVVQTALRLAADLVLPAADAGLRERVGAAMARALEHPLGDVQAAAWRALQALGLPSTTLQAFVRPVRTGLAAKLRRDVDTVLGSETAAVSEDSPPAGMLPAAEVVMADAPIAGFDDLVRELTALVAGADDPQLHERCLDGLVRLGGRRPDDFDRRTAALRRLAKRAAPMRCADLVLAWLDRAPMPRAEPLQDPSGGHLQLWTLWHARRSEAVQVANEGLSLPLLALPTHASFRVEAAVLLERLAAWRAAGVAVLPGDLAQAVRRVRRHERAGLLAALSPAERSVAEPADGALPQATVRLRSEWRTYRDGTRHRRCDVQIDCAPAAPTAPAHPLLQLLRAVVRVDHPGHERAWWYPNEFETLLDLRSLAGIAPHDPELLFALGAHRIGCNLDGHTVARADIAFLEPMLAPDLQLGPNAHLLLAMGLAAKAPELHGIAIDAALAALRSGRLLPDVLADALRQLWAAGFLVGKRLAQQLRALCDADARAAAVGIAGIGAMLQVPIEPGSDLARQCGELLALAVDLVAAAPDRLPELGALQGLRALAAQGAGKAARHARELLAASPNAPCERDRRARSRP